MKKDLLKEQYSLPTCRVLEIRIKHAILDASGGIPDLEEQEESWS